MKKLVLVLGLGMCLFSCSKEEVKVEAGYGRGFMYEGNEYQWINGYTPWGLMEEDCNCAMRNEQGLFRPSPVDCREFSIPPCDQ